MISLGYGVPTELQKPEEWPRVFERHLNDGNLEEVIALYELDARFVPETGRILEGLDSIREVLCRLIDQKTRLSSHVCEIVALGNLSLLYTNFHGTAIDVSGEVVNFTSRAIQLLRKQSDGSWKLIIGYPNSRY